MRIQGAIVGQIKVKLGYDNAVEVFEHLVSERLKKKSLLPETVKMYKAALNDLKYMREETVAMEKVREGFALIDDGLNRR
jgi:hypothetical protein